MINLEKFKNLLSQISEFYRVEEQSSFIYKISNNSSAKLSLALVGLTHGDEIIGIHIINALLEKLLKEKIALEVNLYLILANIPAYLAKKRYIEHDLNRLYGNNNNSNEGQRAKQIKSIVRECDVVIDFHQTIEKTNNPFFLIANKTNIIQYSKKIGASIPRIIKPKTDNVTTLSSYVTAQGKIGITFEVGASGVDALQLNAGLNVALKAMGVFTQEDDSRKTAPSYHVSHFEKYEKGKVIFLKDFSNFDCVAKQQPIVTVDGKEVLSPCAGKILLYPKAWFKENSPIKPLGIFAIVETNTN